MNIITNDNKLDCTSIHVYTNQLLEFSIHWSVNLHTISHCKYLSVGKASKNSVLENQKRYWFIFIFWFK